MVAVLEEHAMEHFVPALLSMGVADFATLHVADNDQLLATVPGLKKMHLNRLRRVCKEARENSAVANGTSQPLNFQQEQEQQPPQAPPAPPTLLAPPSLLPSASGAAPLEAPVEAPVTSSAPPVLAIGNTSVGAEVGGAF